MHTSRNLWVEDQYALRCCGCDARFNMLRRRHHCRHCGQVFCSDCLVTSSPSMLSGVLVGVISSMFASSRESIVKLCHKCDRILAQRGLVGYGSRQKYFSSAAGPVDGPTTSAAAGVTRKNSTAAEGAAAAAHFFHQRLSGECSTSLRSAAASSTHDSPRDRLPTHPEGVKELEISYGLSDVPLYSRNSVTDWLSKLLRDSRKLQLTEPSREPVFISPTPVHRPYPKASFRRAVAPQGGWRFANIFSKTVPAKSLRHFERRVSLHLIKRASRLFAQDDDLASLPQKEEKGKTGMDRVEWIAGICEISWRLVSQTAFVLNKHVSQHFDVICVPGGVFADTKIITGVAFLQTIAFKRMKTFVESPTILLLEGDVGTAVNTKMDLLEYVEGYEGYLDKQYQRICFWKPSVIVVEGNMHHYLQKKIFSQSDAVLILHAGKMTIHRLSRCCNATIIGDLQYVSMADLCNTSILGYCDSFRLLHHGDKPICVFDCPRMPLFTTVILRGAEQAQLLTAVKGLLFQCVLTAYHLSVQAHCMFDLGMLFTEQDSSRMADADLNKIEKKDSEEDDVDLPPWGEASFANCAQCDEYMQLIVCSPRAEDRIETLSMNAAIALPNALMDVDDKNDHLITDSIIVNTVFFECVLGCLAGEDAGGGTPAGSTPNYSVHQSREVFPFYNEGDETLLEYLSGRAKEGDSVRLIVHCDKRIWVKTTTEPSSLSTRQANENLEDVLDDCELAQFSLASQFGGKMGDDIHLLHTKCYATCKICSSEAEGSLTASPLGVACSLHTLNLSWGAFLEFLIYGSSHISLSCGHDLNSGVCVVFLLVSQSKLRAVVNIMVEPLIVYDITTPSMTMPPCGDVAKLHLKDEVEELQRYVTEVIATIKSLTELPAQQQAAAQSQSQYVCPTQLKSQKISFSSLMNLWSSANGAMTDIMEEERGRELLQNAEDLLVKVAALDTMEAVMALRLNGLANLMTDFIEWYKAGIAILERRAGKNLLIQDATVFEDNNWTFSPQGNCGVRLNEPTSLVAAALQASRFFPSSQPEFASDHVQSGKLSQLSELTSSDRAHHSEFALDMEEPHQECHEDSIEFMLGAGSLRLPSAHSSSSCIGSASDALDILKRRRRANEATFNHLMNVQIPWDKTEDITVRVEVMFPEQFAALRYLYTKGRVADMLLSLSRCRPFKSQGGKTNSEFFVTLDERFLMKRIKQKELKHFAEFSSNYFDHIGRMYSKPETLDENDGPLPCGSVLAKVFGVFSVHIKRKRRVSEIPGEIRYFVLMENIFFSRCVDIIYDLKGSQRNRTAVEGSSVLLDQDLITAFRKGDFFYCKNEAKSFIMDSLTCDAYLLSVSSIMDYSLIAGLNRSSRQLYLGIVDYLHPYTGAKVIESKVKAGLDTVLGHAGRDPTIIDPVSYRMRFARWLDGCFCGVPEKDFTVRRVLAKKKRRNGA